MRFERLFLRAFGPFTNQEIDLSGGAPGGLHVIYGPNEAGKSTSLRAVSAFLFGMPHVSPDAHLHPSNRLNVGAILESEGRRYELTRLKRRKDALVDVDGHPLSVDPLPALLGNLDEGSFSARFGLDQAVLERGAEALLGGSEQGLFAAGTAGAEARKVLEDLDKQSSELYLPRGKVPRLNRANADYEIAARDAKRAERPPEKWLEQERAHRDATALVVSLRAQRGEVRTELRRLNRLRSLMSDLAAYQETTACLQALSAVPNLPEDATLKRIDSQQRLQEAEVEARRIREEIASFETEIAALPPQSRLIEIDDEQLALSTRVGTALSARKDMPKRTAALLEQARQLAVHLRDLGRDVEPGSELKVAREVLPSAQTIGSVSRLLTQRGKLTAEVSASSRVCRKIVLELGRHDEQMGEGPAPDNLEALEGALSDAHAAQALVASHQQDEERRAEARTLAERLRQQMGTSLGADELIALLPTADDSTARIAAQRERLRRRNELKGSLGRFAEQQQQLESRLREEQADELPSEQKLEAARLKRDEQLGRLEHETTSDALAREANFENLRGAIARVDHLADRLRREADRVAEAASLVRELRSIERQQATVGEQLSSCESEIHEVAAAHQELVGALGIRGESRGEGASSCAPNLERAESWFAALRELAIALHQEQALAEVIAKKEKRIRAVARRLRDTLADAPAGIGLAGLIALATRRLREGHQQLDRQKAQQEARLRLLAARDEAELRQQEACAALSTWEEQWARAVAPLSLEPDVPVERAQEALFTLERIARLVDVATNLEGRIIGMERDTENLAEEVRRIAARHLPGLLDLDPVDAAVELQEAIRAARRTNEERGRIKKLLDARRAALSEVEARRSSAEAQLAHLVESAGATSLEELPKIEESAREQRLAQAKINELSRSIRDASDGASVDELIEEAKPWHGQTRRLVDRVDDLDEQNHELEESLRAAESDAEGKRLGLDTYRSEDVVFARQAVSHKAAEARAALREYLVLKAAQTLLHKQVESYAEQFAGPIAGRAGDLFERLTLGRYSGLKIGVGEKTLRCVRGSEELEVSQLSRGTRAQLYFALRLASLEKYFAEQPAVPLVFDDLFVEFDDDRTTAAFEILAEMASKVQVLYFTHLARDVEAASNAVGPHLLFTHSIGVN